LNASKASRKIDEETIEITRRLIKKKKRYRGLAEENPRLIKKNIRKKTLLDLVVTQSTRRKTQSCIRKINISTILIVEA